MLFWAINEGLQLTRLILVLLVWVVSSHTPCAMAKILFEGYAKVMAGSEQIGFFVQRYELDDKKKQFISTYFIQLSAKGGNLQESLKALANDKFEPISYQYTSKSDAGLKTIDAKIEKNKLTALISSGGKPISQVETLPKGTFLSTFLQYMMLQKGVSAGKKFGYSAISEEDGKPFPGEATVLEEPKINGISGYKIKNVFKKSEFISFMTSKAEVLATVSQAQGISTDLVASPNGNLLGLELPQKAMKLLFGGIPLGKENILSNTVEAQWIAVESSYKADVAAPAQKSES